MARILDLNAQQRSLLDVTLQDAERTVVHLDIPTEGMVNDLQTLIPEFEKIKTGDRSNVDIMYNLAASLLNCNQDYFAVKPEELPGKYRMNLVSVINFFAAYFAALEDLTKEKN